MSPRGKYLSWDDLPSLFPELGDKGGWLGPLRKHQEMVEAAAAHTRVSSVPAEEAVGRHYAESLEVWRLAQAAGPAARVVDVGSGGGYPGMVIAVVSPETEVALVEPLQKRARLLQRMTRELKLTNATVHWVRAETAGRGTLREWADVGTARAVAPLPELLEYVAPLVAEGGRLALAKGSDIAAELERAGVAMRQLGCELTRVTPMRPEISTTVSVAVFRRVGPMVPGLPRREGVPGKRPLGGRQK